MEFVEQQGASVVLAGHFNPSIFNPDWLARQSIISPDEADNANVTVIHPEIAQFQVASFSFEVTSERFAVNATVEPFIQLADIVADIFKDKLGHTPIEAMGINYFAHFRLRDRGQQIRLGRLLAPLAPWGEWGQAIDNKEADLAGGLLNLTMQQSKPDQRAGGNFKVTVQPSNVIEPGLGVFMHTNDHFDRGTNSEMVDFAQVCVDQISSSLTRSRKIVSNMTQFARGL